MTPSTAVGSANPRDRLDQRITAELRRLLDERTTRAERYGESVRALWEVAATCALGGKLVRPRLMLAAFDALDARATHADARYATAHQLAAAIELLHYAFLLHDDVIDADVQRRGRPNLVGTLADQRSDATPAQMMHWARSSGILVGDMLLSDVHSIFARIDVPAPVRTRLLDVLDHAIMESVAGEYLDVAFSDRILSPDLEAVRAMTGWKTAAYTFELPLRCAAILADASPEMESTIGAVGRHLGSAFQLHDDLHSTFGASDTHGKDEYSDLREGKITAIIAYARTTPQWPQIAPLFGNPALTRADAERMRAQLSAVGADRFVRDLLNSEVDAARHALAAAAVPESLSVMITDLMNSLQDGAP